MPTIKEVAVRAGVSPATVSRVLNQAQYVSAATRAKVERAVRELGYVPNVMARGLRSRQSHTLALIVSDVTNPFWTTVVRAVEDKAQERGFSVFLYNTDENPSKQRRYLDIACAQQVDGVIVAPFDTDAGKLSSLRHQGIPTVVVDRRVDGWDVDTVRCDSISAARAMVRHLVGLGHQRIAMLSGPASTSTAEERVVGYCIALSEAGIRIEKRLIRRGEYRVSSGGAMARAILDERLGPTAVFAANNSIAIGAIQAIGARGLCIPRDVALACCDDVHNTSQLFPFLTVNAFPAYDMGAKAMELLLSRLDAGVELESRHVILPTRLIVRHSCGSRLAGHAAPILCLPLPEDAGKQTDTLVEPLTIKEQQDLAALAAQLIAPS
jgi:LacI family transcriptional regulator